MYKVNPDKRWDFCFMGNGYRALKIVCILEFKKAETLYIFVYK